MVFKYISFYLKRNFHKFWTILGKSWETSPADISAAENI
jgi:hypothetical protein